MILWQFLWPGVEQKQNQHSLSPDNYRDAYDFIFLRPTKIVREGYLFGIHPKKVRERVLNVRLVLNSVINE